MLSPTPSPVPASIRKEAADLLRQNLAAWFPRCRADSGFHQAFGRDWQPLPESTRFIVYQSRLIWVAAKGAEAVPDLRERLLDHVRHGVQGLSETLSDKDHGGHFWMADVEGRPLGTSPPIKIAYGLAFALFGLSAAAQALGEESVRRNAADAFEFLERLHDDSFGGYYESCEADGTPLAVTRPSDEGRAYGPSGSTSQKSQNTHLHLLEALLEYESVEPGELVASRVRELLSLMKGPMFVEPGVHRTRFTADWRPIDTRWEIGHDLEAAYLLLAANSDEQARAVAHRMIEFNIAHGFDEGLGGFYELGPHPGKISGRTKVWWVQAEALNALVYGLRSCPEHRSDLRPILERQWSWFRDHQWDPEFGGFYARMDELGNVLGDGDKAEPWKACYHDTRALLNLAAETL